MSVGSGNGDDIEDKIEDLLDSIEELTDLMRFAMTPDEGEGAAGEEGAGPDDLWDEGTTKAVDTLGEFRDWRTKAAREDGVSSPFFRPYVFDTDKERIEAEVDLFLGGYRNLNELYTRLSDEVFDLFLAEYLKESTRPSQGGEPAVSSELLDIHSPDMQFYGIVDVEGELQVRTSFTPFDFISAYGYIWHFEANVSDSLGLNPDPRAELIVGEKTIEDLNKDLARAIYTTRGMTLPDDYSGLLPSGMREDFD